MNKDEFLRITHIISEKDRDDPDLLATKFLCTPSATPGGAWKRDASNGTTQRKKWGGGGGNGWETRQKEPWNTIYGPRLPIKSKHLCQKLVGGGLPSVIVGTWKTTGRSGRNFDKDSASRGKRAEGAQTKHRADEKMVSAKLRVKVEGARER